MISLYVRVLFKSRLKPKKCNFFHPEVKYLGHVISQDGVSPDPEKVEKVRNYPVPNTPTEVRQFMGLASYYRRFIQEVYTGVL